MNVKEAEKVDKSSGIEIQSEHYFFEARIVLEEHEKYKPLVEAVEATHEYFKACAIQWAKHDGLVVSPKGNVIEGSEEVERLCNIAGEKVRNAREYYRKDILGEK